jgi:PAS domain S-box-containing protein
VEGLQATADDYLVKPFAARELLARVATHVKMANLRRETAEREERLRNEGEIERQKLHASQELLAETSRLYRELQNREAKIRRLVDANIMGIFTWNLEGKIVEANEAFLRMVGYGREDLVSGRMRWTDLTPTEWRDRDARALAELTNVGTVQPYEKEFFRKNGGRIPVLAGGALFEESGHEGVAFVLDLSEQKRAKEALQSSEGNLAAIVNTIPTAAWTTRPDGYCDFLKWGVARLCGHDCGTSAGLGVGRSDSPGRPYETCRGLAIVSSFGHPGRHGGAHSPFRRFIPMVPDSRQSTEG